MLGLTCEKDCPDLSWDFVETQLYMFAGLWGLMLVGGIVISIYSLTADYDEKMERMEVLQSKMQSSKFFVALCTCLSIFQCVIFCFRTFSKTVDGISFLLEIVACILYGVNLYLSWIIKSLKGFYHITPFMFSKAFVDTLLIPSVLCLAIVEVDGSKAWFSFSFLSALHILECWRWTLDIRRINLQVLSWQVIDVTVNIVVLVYFAAMMMMSLENLGEPQALERLNEEKWNTLSAIYYVFVTISTVGYGDLAPITSLGRLFAVATIFGGISAVVMAMYKILTVLNLHSSGGGHFAPRMSARHIVVTGNPSITMALDFIAELFHSDHSDEAEDLHLVFLLPRGTSTMHAIQRELRQRKNVHVAPKVHILQGSVLEAHDLQRVAPLQATAVFVLPDIQSKDYMHEDTENIIRMMAVLKVNPQCRMIILLMKAENQQLVHEAGANSAQDSNITCLAIDQFKLELVGKSCQVPGFSTLICNLFKTISDTEEEDYSNLGSWLQDYDKGTGNEIYEVELSQTYAQRGAVFSEVVLDVIEQTDGAVYLIGLVEVSPVLGTKVVLVNPGTWYPIKDQKNAGIVTSGIFIAADREAVQQCDGGVFLGRRERPLDDKPKLDAKLPRVWSSVAEDGEFRTTLSKHAERKVDAVISGKPIEEKKSGLNDLADVYVDPLEDLIRRDPNLTKEMQASARNLIQLAKQQKKASEPQRMPLKQLATGGHILFLCIGVRDGEEVRLGAEHLLKPLRGDPSPTAIDVPLLILAPSPPRDWHRVSEDKKVFYMRGSPLSLFDLERANFRHASAILICHSGTPRLNLSEAWMVDSDVVCCARLIESELPQNSTMTVVAEIAVDSNHPFIPLPGLTPLGEPTRGGGGKSDLMTMPEFCPRCGARCQQDAMACIECGAMPGDEFNADYSMMKGGSKNRSKEDAGPQIDEYYRQARYACGQLFVGNVVTAMTVNTFYNPSLWELVHQMIKAEVVMVPLPRDWEGKSYYEYFDKLLREDELMAVAIYRNAETKDGKARKIKGRKWSYIYTAPPAKETHMQRGDRVICFASAFKLREEDLDVHEKVEPPAPMIEDVKEPTVVAAASPVKDKKLKRKPMANRGGAGGGAQPAHNIMIMR